MCVHKDEVKTRWGQCTDTTIKKVGQDKVKGGVRGEWEVRGHRVVHNWGDSKTNNSRDSCGNLCTSVLHHYGLQ